MKFRLLFILCVAPLGLAAQDLGFQGRFTRSAGGGLILEMGEAGVSVSVDARGRLAAAFDEAGHDVAKNKDGKAVHVRRKGGTSALKLAYDTKGRLVSVKDASGKILKLSYKKDGTLRSLKLPSGAEEEI